MRSFKADAVSDTTTFLGPYTHTHKP
jgi:hypothetical protein